MVRLSSILMSDTVRFDHAKSTPYYPQENRQADTTNKTLLKMLSQTVCNEPKRWSDFIPLVFWAYRTSKRTSTQATPFSLGYGTKGVVPIEIMVHSARLALPSKVTDPQELIHDVEAVKKEKTEG